MVNLSNYKITYSKSKLEAGSNTDLKITITIGNQSIDDSGSLKLVYKIISDAGEFQFENKKQRNFVSVSTSKPNIKVGINAKTKGFVGKMHERPWTRGLQLVFQGDSLRKGDKVHVDIKNWEVQTFTEKNFEFKLFIDPYANAKYFEVPSPRKIEIIASKFHSYRIVQKFISNNKIRLYIFAEDMYGNTRESNSIDLKKIEVITPKGLKLTQTRNNKGIELDHKIDKEYTGGEFILKENGKQYTSNYLSSNFKNHFWADFHGQSEETVGTNSLTDYFDYARDEGVLDITSIQGNDFEISDDHWKEINTLTKTYNNNKDSRFLALPGYEWSGNTEEGGDRNVIYFDYKQPIFRSSFASIFGKAEYINIAPTANHLFKDIDKKKTILFAHIGGRYANLDFHDERVEKAIELHSVWGTFDWFREDLIKRKLVAGFVANSDGHTGKPGNESPTQTYFNVKGGLTCISAKGLKFNDVYDALKKRHFYAVTGQDRILLNFEFQADNKIYSMGDLLTGSVKDGVVNLEAFSSTPIQWVKIYKNLKVVEEFYPGANEEEKIQVLYSGSNSKGRERNYTWKGKLISSSNITKLEKINFIPHRTGLYQTGTELEWTGLTSGNVQGFTFAGEDSDLHIDLNGQKTNANTQHLGQKPQIIKYEGINSYLSICKIYENQLNKKMKITSSIDSFDDDYNALYAEVRLINGTSAWTSPVFILSDQV